MVRLAVCDWVGGIALDSTNVYWTTNEVVMKVAKASGTATQLARGPAGAGDILADETAIYWADGDGTLMRLAK